MPISKSYICRIIRENPSKAKEILYKLDLIELNNLYPGVIQTPDPIQCIIDICLDPVAKRYFSALKLKEYYSSDNILRYKKYREEFGAVSNTFRYFQILYPDDIATHFLSEYKSKRPNVYDAQYISERDGISVEEAIDQIEEYKRNKATSKQNFIKKYGEIEGNKKFNEFKSKSLDISTNKALWIKTNNATEEDWFNRCRRKSKRCIDYWIYHHKMSVADAKRAVSDHQKSNSGVFYEYYAKLGYTHNEILEILLDISKRKDGASIRGIQSKYPELSYQEVLDRYDNICKSKSNPRSAESLARARATLERNGRWVPYELLSEYEIYKRAVAKVTRAQKVHPPETIKVGIAGTPGAFQLDHKFSVREGFLNDIDPKIIGNAVNLEYIPWEENLKKSYNCSITITELLELYYHKTNEN